MQTHQLVDLELSEVSGVDHPASLVEGWLVMKSDDPISAAFTAALDPQEPDVEMTITDEPVVEEPIVVLDDTLAKEMGDMRKALADMTGHFEKATAERDALTEAADIEKAEAAVADWDNVPGMVDEFAPVLRSLDDEQTAAVKAIFDACQIAFAEAGVTKEIGTDASGDTDSLSTIEGLAKALVADGKADNIHKAIALVAAERPDLYAAYVGEKG